MNLTVEKTEQYSVVKVEGRIDASNSGELQSFVATLIDNGVESLLLDFAKVPYISSAGLQVLLMVAKKLRGGKKRFVLCYPQENVREVLDLTGFSNIITIVDDLYQAQALFTVS